MLLASLKHLWPRQSLDSTQSQIKSGSRLSSSWLSFPGVSFVNAKCLFEMTAPQYIYLQDMELCQSDDFNEHFRNWGHRSWMARCTARAASQKLSSNQLRWSVIESYAEWCVRMGQLRIEKVRFKVGGVRAKMIREKLQLHPSFIYTIYPFTWCSVSHVIRWQS